jgi:hypothetical protein
MALFRFVFTAAAHVLASAEVGAALLHSVLAMAKLSRFDALLRISPSILWINCVAVVRELLLTE